MNCVNCGTDLPANARFCLNCGAAQPVKSGTNGGNPKPVTTAQPAADGGTTGDEPQSVMDLPPIDGEFDWLAREAMIDPRLDYSAQRRYDTTVSRTFGCLGYVFFAFVALLAFVPGVFLLAVFGLPAAPILGILTYFNVWQLQMRWHGLKFVRDLPGINSLNRSVLAVSVALYTVALSALSIALLTITNKH